MLRLLLETADLSPSATVDQRAAVDKFLNGIPRKTQAINTACAEICESRFDRVLFSVIDTPGLDFSQGKELTLERQVNTIVNYIDTQYADTMSEVCYSLLTSLSNDETPIRNLKLFARAKATNTYTCKTPLALLSLRVLIS